MDRRGVDGPRQGSGGRVLHCPDGSVGLLEDELDLPVGGHVDHTGAVPVPLRPTRGLNTKGGGETQIREAQWGPKCVVP